MRTRPPSPLSPVLWSICLEGEGFCLADEECSSGLVCGADNCSWDSEVPLSNMDSLNFSPAFPILQSCCKVPCVENASPISLETCCVESSDVCLEGEGFCLADKECATGLVCGAENCPWEEPGGSAHRCCRQPCKNEPDDGCCSGVSCVKLTSVKLLSN